jgi:hypothetical protein
VGERWSFPWNQSVRNAGFLQRAFFSNSHLERTERQPVLLQLLEWMERFIDNILLVLALKRFMLFA